MPIVHHSSAKTNLSVKDLLSSPNSFDLPIRYLHLSTGLRVIWGCNLVGDEIFLHQLLKDPIAEVLTTITYDCSGSTKTSKYIILQKLNHYSVVIGLASNNLHPFGHIIHSNKDIKMAKGVWEWSHKIDSPHIKNLNNQNGVERHHIPS
jgi:hypothetical protein